MHMIITNRRSLLPLLLMAAVAGALAEPPRRHQPAPTGGSAKDRERSQRDRERFKAQRMEKAELKRVRKALKRLEDAGKNS